MKKSLFLILLALLLGSALYLSIKFMIISDQREGKEYLVRVDVEPLFSVNGTYYWPVEGGKYPYHVIGECLLDKENPDWSCFNYSYSEIGFLKGLVNIFSAVNDEGIKVSLSFTGDTLRWMNDHRNYSIIDKPPGFSNKKTGEYKIEDLIDDIDHFRQKGNVELGLHATRCEDLGFEIEKRCAENYRCAEEYFDRLIKLGIKDFENVFERKPVYWHKHLGVHPVEEISSQHICIYPSSLEKNGIEIFGAHFTFMDEPVGIDSQVVSFSDYSVKEIPLGRLFDPIQSNFPHFTTTFDGKLFILTTHSWNFIDLPNNSCSCSECKYNNQTIFKDYTSEFREFVRSAKYSGVNFLHYKDLSGRKPGLQIVC